MGEPICKIARENGGSVPLSCAFGCHRGCDTGHYTPTLPSRTPMCERCGDSCTWHHTGTRWALMGANGRLHDCRPGPASVDDFPDLDAP